METIQTVMDKKLLLATYKAARRAKQNRSALVRDAVRRHLQSLEVRAKEDRECEGYRKHPQTIDEIGLWEASASWPAD